MMQSLFTRILLLCFSVFLIGVMFRPGNTALGEGLFQSPPPTPTLMPPLITPTPFEFYKRSEFYFLVDKTIAQVGDHLTYTMVMSTPSHLYNIFVMQTTVPTQAVWQNNLRSTQDIALYLNDYVWWLWRDYFNDQPPPSFVTTTFEVAITTFPPGGVIENEALFRFDDVDGLHDFTRTVRTQIVTPTPTSTPTPTASPTPTATASPTPPISPTPTPAAIATSTPRPPTTTIPPHPDLEPSATPLPPTPPPGWPHFLPETGEASKLERRR